MFCKIVRSDSFIKILSALVYTFIFFAYLRANLDCGIAAYTWMFIFPFERINENLFAFLIQLRVPIPPHMAIVEIFWHRLFGNLHTYLYVGYDLLFYSCFLISILLCRNKKLIVFNALFSCLVVYNYGYLHKMNAQMYDLLFPLEALCFCGCVQWATRLDKQASRLGCYFLAGFFLSLAELTRPFCIVPAAIVWIVLASCRRLNRKEILIFSIPILLISGAWHAKLFFLNHGQLLTSNHGGYNLQRGWTQVSIPDYPYGDDPPFEEDLWPNINTESHYQSSQKICKHIFIYILKHPIQSMNHAVEKVFQLLAPPEHWFYVNLPNNVWAELYIFSARAIALALIPIAYTNLRWRYVKKNSIRLIVPIFFFTSVFLMAIGEDNEQSRFYLQIAPMLIPSINALIQLKNESEKDEL